MQPEACYTLTIQPPPPSHVTHGLLFGSDVKHPRIAVLGPCFWNVMLELSQQKEPSGTQLVSGR